MEALDQLNAKIDELASANTALQTEVSTSNAKADALIVAVGVVTTRLKELADAANQGGNVTTADINAVIARVDQVMAGVTATTAEVVAQEAETDAATAAATAAAAPAPAPAPEPAPAPVEPPAETPPAA